MNAPPETSVKNLTAKAWLALALLAVVMGLLLFVPAGTVRWWQAWAFLAVFFGASALHTLYLVNHDPGLLQRRLRGGPTAERKPAQKVIMLFTSIGFIALLVVPALDRRFDWSAVPSAVAVAGDVLVAIAYYVIYLVFRENSFAAAIVYVAADQKLVSTGPYAVVRHPMYAGALLYVLGMPLALGSYWAFFAVAAMLPFLLWRLFDEEKVLANELPGYAQYQSEVRWRLIPGIF
jgi:protein-S-isoprenylcysteine O-methyltransferase Ste14